MGGRLHGILSAEGVGTLVLTGGETDVCVLSAALGAIDLGYRVVVLRDAVCSGADDTHDASLELLGDRFSVQLELLMTEEFFKIRLTPIPVRPDRADFTPDANFWIDRARGT